MARYECVEGSSKKFWEVSLDGASLTTRWGRIGTDGQSKTKTFSGADAARKEHDRLVREKVGKGYALVTGGTTPAPPAAVAPVRTDLSIYNEATAFLVFSDAMIGRQLTPDADSWTAAIANGDLMPVELVQDDPFVIRVVVGDALTATERDEAIGQLAWTLRVPDGTLVVAGGIELVMEPVGSEVSNYLAQYAGRVAVAPGDYKATLLAYVPGINGENLLNRARGTRGEGVGTWFRRTRGDDLPVWVRRWCQVDPREDRGREDEWATEPTKRERAKQDATEYVHFLLHLTPLDGVSPRQPTLEQGFFSFDAFDVRLPEQCPIGIEAQKPKAARRKSPPAEPPALQTIDVAKRMGKRALTALRGGAVAHPITGLGDVFRLAWLATDAADPEIRIALPAGAGFTPSWPEVENVAVSTAGGAVRVGFGGGGKWAQLSAAQSIARHLGDLPDGSVVELMTSPGAYFWERDEDEDEPEQHPDAGVQRYRGVVRGGTWHIDETFPAVDAGTLRDALALSASVNGGRTLAIRDDAEGAAVQERLDGERFLFTSNPVKVKDATIGLAKKDVQLLHFVAAALFRTRWADVWASYVEDDDANDEFDAAIKALGDQITAKASAALAERTDLELVLEGKAGTFQKLDLLQARPLEDDLIESADRQLRQLGYEIVGDLVCSRFPDVIVRGYARPGGDTWGVYLAGILESSFEFVTLFEHAGLTTTFKAGPPDEPAKGFYRSRHPKLDFRTLKPLHAEHEKRKAKLPKKVGTPRPAPVDLEALARAIDESVSRQLEAELSPA